MIGSEHREWIEKATYEELLRRWRFAPTEDTIFHLKTGAYYQQIMTQRRNELSHDDQVSISKKIGWCG